MTERLSRIAFCARSQSRFVMLALARELRAQHNVRLHLYCYGPQEMAHYQAVNADGLFDSVTDADILLKRCFDANLDEDAVIRRARNLESRFGTTINRMIVPDRHFGRGYALGGFFHPRSRYSETTSYLQAVHAYCESLDFWLSEFEERGITACVNGPREAAAAARMLDIPYRVMAASRYKNYHYWAWNEYYETPEFEKRWKTLVGSVDVDFEAPYHAHQKSRSNSLGQFTFRTMVHRIGALTARYIYWNLRGYQKAKGYYYRENVAYLYRMWSDYRKLKKISGTKLSELEGKKFVYYPLHIEPETALHGFSPEYFYQQSLIAAVSRDLPAGVYLAVKEAFGAVGRRPKNFYRQIEDLKNVIWLDTWEMGFECARQANAVVTICGTTGLEAAGTGTPVIAFGKHNIYNFLPSVRVVENEADLAPYLREVLSDDIDRVAIRQEGRRLIQAIADCSFDMGEYDYVRLEEFENSAISAACAALASSLESYGEQRAQHNPALSEVG